MPVQVLRRLTGLAAGASLDETFDNVRAKEGDVMVNLCAAFIARITVNITSAATSDAIAQSQWAGILDRFELFDAAGRPWFYEPLDGPYFREMRPFAELQGYSDAPAIAANSNTTHTVVVNVVVPYRLKKLKDKFAVMQPSAFFRRLKGQLGASTLFGTGQTIDSIDVEMLVVHEPRARLELAPRLKYGQQTLARFKNEVLTMGDGAGRVVDVAIADLDADGSTSIGATDFVDCELRGRVLNVERMPVDLPTDAYNERLGVGDADDARRDRPTAGTAQAFTLWSAPPDAKISELPLESALDLSLITGAGNPGLTDQVAIYSLIERRDMALYALNFANAPGFAASDARIVEQAIQEGKAAKGNTGPVSPQDPVEPFLRKPIAVQTITNR